MSLVGKLSLVILILTLGAQILYRRSFWSTSTGIRNYELGIKNNIGRRFFRFFSKSELQPAEIFSKFLRYIWVISVVAIFGLLTFWAILQYKLWGSSDLTKLFLPPHQSFGYFYSYVGKRFFAPWLISLLFAIVVSRTAKHLNKKYGERFFWNEEIELISFGIFLVGYPGFFIYLSLILVLGVLFSTFFTLLNFSLEKLGRASSLFSKGRLPLYYFWIPTAILAIIIKVWLFPILRLDIYLGNFAI